MRVDWNRNRLLAVAISVLLISGCVSTDTVSLDPRSLLPAFHSRAGNINLVDAAMQSEEVDLLALDQDMIDFAERHTRNARSGRQRLMMLHRSLRSMGLLDLEYDPQANGSASQVFARGAANCLSYASLLIAMARHIGLNAKYQVVSTRPEWNRVGERIAVTMHVNTTVSLRTGEHFEVDIEPLQRHRVIGTQVLSDSVAKAHYYNNISMSYFFEGDGYRAFINLARALELAPQLDYLWVNIGAIYRHNKQHDAAELSYQAALQINPEFSTAMNNLAVLYRMEGRDELAKYYSDQIEKHRQRNPYFHFQQAQLAEYGGDYEKAINHLKKAIKRKRGEGEFYYMLSRIYHKTNRRNESLKNISLAIDHAKLLSQQKRYKVYQRSINKDDQLI